MLPTPQRIFFDNFWKKKKLETLNFAQSNFNDIRMGGMIKFRIYPKIWQGERSKFGKVLEKCQNYRFLDILWDILDKMKDNLGQECVKRGSILPGQNWNNHPWFPWKYDSFSSLDPTFYLSLPGNSTLTKIIFLKWAIIRLFARKLP